MMAMALQSLAKKALEFKDKFEYFYREIFPLQILTFISQTQPLSFDVLPRVGGKS